MTKTRDSYTFENAERFEKFLKDNMKSDFNLDACYDDFIEQVNGNGSSSYELGSSETKSGRPETIGFHRIDTEVEEDEWQTTFEF